MSERRGRYRPLFILAGLVAGLLAGVTLVRRLDVVEVIGGSMAPALLPGDRLLVESLSYARRRPRPGEVVITRDPRQPERELIKRVESSDGDLLDLRGDAPDQSTDSRAFGAVPAADVRWRAVVRYWPPRRVGPIAGHPDRA